MIFGSINGGGGGKLVCGHFVILFTVWFTLWLIIGVWEGNLDWPAVEVLWFNFVKWFGEWEFCSFCSTGTGIPYPNLW